MPVTEEDPKVVAYKQFLLDEERVVLEKMEKMVEEGKTITPTIIK